MVYKPTYNWGGPILWRSRQLEPDKKGRLSMLTMLTRCQSHSLFQILTESTMVEHQ